MLELDETPVHFRWDPTLEPVAVVEDGAVVHCRLAEVTDDQVSPKTTAADLAGLDWDRVYPLRGPLAVHGAEAGDAVEIELLAAETLGWGWTAILPGLGLLAEDFPEARLHIWDLGSGEVADFLDVAKLPLRPFPGTLGVCPAVDEPTPVMPPGCFGGNIDCRDVVVGSRLRLPVQVPGALLSIGDGHGAQGDGEVCVTAIEAPLEVRFRVHLRKGLGLRAPQLLVPPEPNDRLGRAGWFAAMGVAADLMVAAKDALRSLIDHLVAEYRLEAADAYLLASVAAQLRISEVVDAPNWVVSAYLPLAIFE